LILKSKLLVNVGHKYLVILTPSFTFMLQDFDINVKLM